MSGGVTITQKEAEKFRKLGWNADRWAISSESHRALDVFAHLASNGTLTFDEVVGAVEDGKAEEFDPGYLARLGRIVAVRPTGDRLSDFALEALRIGAPQMDKLAATQPVRELFFQLLLWNDEIDAARAFLDQDAALQNLYFGYMSADLANPRIAPEGANYSEWLELYNAPFVSEGLAPLAPDPEADVLFDSLNAMPRPELLAVPEGQESDADAEQAARRRLLEDAPLVTVILTTFNPEPDELRTSVRSILRQTWPHLELLVVDDHSPEMPDGLLEEFEALDDRISVIRMPVNGGTYLARNAGIRAARGTYVTGQDTDDWSHPQRLERQLLAFHGHEGSAGVMVMANRTDDRLVRTAVGFAPQRRCEVSLMLRTEDARNMGGYVPMRKGADSEFRERLIRHLGTQVIELSAPLYMTRLSAGSLSRADFRHGWTAPARLSFSSAYRYWHETSSLLLSPLGDERGHHAPPFSAPSRISGRGRDEGTRLDVCFLGDWRSFGPLERAALDEIESLLDAHLLVGVLQLDSPFSDAVSARILLPRLQAWINQGRVLQIMPDEEMSARLVIVRDPAVIDYAREQPFGLQTDHLMFVATDPFVEREDVAPSYRRERTQAAAERLLGLRGQWIRPQGTSAELFRSAYPGSEAELVYPLVTYARPPRHRRRRPGAPVVIGRGARNDNAQWPSDPELLSSLYPPDDGHQVRVLGDARGGVRVLRLRRLPANWIDFRSVELSAERFWHGVDVAVQFDEEDPGLGPDRALLEALAARVPVVCGERHRAHLDGAAVYVRAEEAPAALASLAADPALQEELARRGAELLDNQYSPAEFRRFVTRVLAGIAEVEYR